MRNDVQLAALKAAAKVAFSMALLNACSSTDGTVNAGTGTEKDTDQTESDGSGAASNPSREKKLLGKKPVPSSSAAKEDSGTVPPTPQNCQAVLAAAYPTPGDYQPDPVPQSKAVVTCCEEELTKNAIDSTYRWDCCVAFNAEVNPQIPRDTPEHGLACTPWGPPVPPSMKRIPRAKPEVLAWIASAVA
jgi:hypothetical protein